MKRRNFPKPGWILVLLFVIACGSSGVPAVVTQVVVIQPTVAAPPTQALSATTLSPTVDATTVAVTITTESGMTIRLPELRMSTRCSGSVGRDPRTIGVMTRSGVDVAWKYVRRLEMGAQREDGIIPVQIELVNGERVETSLGPLGFYVSVKGASDLGDFESLLTDLKTVEVEQPQPPTIPSSPPPLPEGPSATVQVGDATIPVSGLSFYRYNCDSNWIPEKHSSESLFAVPLASGLKVDLVKLSEIRFDEDAERTLQVTIQTLDGQTVTDKLTSGQWRLRGKTRLGEYDLYLSRNLLPVTVTIVAP